MRTEEEDDEEDNAGSGTADAESSVSDGVEDDRVHKMQKRIAESPPFNDPKAKRKHYNKIFNAAYKTGLRSCPQQLWDEFAQRHEAFWGIWRKIREYWQSDIDATEELVREWKE